MSTPRRSLLWALPFVGLSLLPGSVWAQTENKELKSAWADFNHYVLIARPDLAAASGKVLLESSTAELLDVVESSEYKDEFGRTLERAGRTEGLKDLSAQIARAIQTARLERSRNAERISQDIAKLSGSMRENTNATERLTAAGQYAAPQLLSTLLNDRLSAQHPFVIKAMVAVGQPMIDPLMVALPALPPRTQSQVAQVLAEIGYPRALPALKQILENAKTDPNVKTTVQAAYTKLAAAANVPAGMSAAELYTRLGQNYYQTATVGGELPGYDKAQAAGILWEYKPETGLLSIPVPGTIFGDVLAMRAAQKALTLDEKSESAMTLWLLGNLRREIRLGGAEDPSYPANLKEPLYYLRLAGPRHQQAVLARALEDDDVALGFKAISALAETAGSSSLMAGGSQPLIKALYHADRRIRIQAAMVLAHARGLEPFAGSDRVVRILAEAIRPADVKYALAIAPKLDDLNKLAANLKDQGLEVIGGGNIGQVSGQITSSIGLDVVAAQMPVDELLAFVQQARDDYRLAALPVVGVINEKDASELARKTEGMKHKPIMAAQGNADSLKNAVHEALAQTAGMSDAENSQTALLAIATLRDLALCKDSLFKAVDAQPVLIRCLNGKAADLAQAAAQVLAILDTKEAQQALAEAALDEQKPVEQRVALMGQLAASARAYGNKLATPQVEKILALVGGQPGELTSAAARVAGSLSLPTINLLPSISAK